MRKTDMPTISAPLPSMPAPTAGRSILLVPIMLVCALIAWLGIEAIGSDVRPTTVIREGVDEGGVAALVPATNPVQAEVASIGASGDSGGGESPMPSKERVAVSAPLRAEVRTFPDRVHEALRTASYFGKEDGLVVGPAHGLSVAAVDMVCSAHEAFQRECAEITSTRQPIVSALSEAKQSRGEVEPLKTTRNMPPDLTSEQKKQWIADAANARLPTKPGQIVVTVGSVLVRIDVAEDHRLGVMHERFEACGRLFVEHVRSALTYR